MEFSIYLAESVGDPDSLIKEEALPYATKEESDAGVIYLFPAHAKPPTWVGEVIALWPGISTSNLYSARAGAVVVIEQGHVSCLATFGTGYLHVERDRVVPDFGRKVVISCVSASHLKQVSRQGIEGARLQAIEQTPKAESLDKYGIDYEKDLLKGMAGKPRKRAFGDYIAGADALHVSIPGGVSDLTKRLRLYLHAYRMKIVQPELRWYDRLKRVVDPLVLPKLEAKLDAALQSPGFLEPILALPEILDRTRSAYYYGFQHQNQRHSAPCYTDPALDDWRQWLTTHKGLLPSLQEAQKRDFYVYDASGVEVAAYKLLRCLLWSCNLGSVSYFLHAGVWYEVSAALVDEIRQFLLLAYKTKSFIAWPPYKGGNEDAYNILAASSLSSMILMDKSNIVLKGAKTAIEPCDLIDFSSKVMVFVKRKKVGSSGLAHLFTQVMNGVDTYFSYDPEMRQEMAKRMNPSQNGFDPLVKPNPTSWTVVILILGVKKRGLPFFSQMAAKQAITLLRRRYGVDVCIEYA